MRVYIDDPQFDDRDAVGGPLRVLPIASVATVMFNLAKSAVCRDNCMTPLMLSTDEAEAAVLGALWVADRGDPGLANAARDLLAKIATVVPDHLRPFVTDPSIGAAPIRATSVDGLDMARLRAAIRAGCMVRIRYRDEAGRASERVVWPVIVGYADTVRLLAAWCELRQAFRHFRADRIEAAVFLDEGLELRPGDLRWD